jgi:hypothetical protein
MRNGASAVRTGDRWRWLAMACNGLQWTAMDCNGLQWLVIKSNPAPPALDCIEWQSYFDGLIAWQMAASWRAQPQLCFVQRKS